MNKKYILLLALLIVLVLVVACKPEVASNAYQATQPVMSGGCSV